MCDDDGRSTSHQLVQGFDDGLFRGGIQTHGRLVKNQERSIADDCPGNGYSLALTAGERDSALADHGVVALRHFLDKLLRVGEFCSVPDFFGRGAGLPIGNVLPNRGAKEQRVLKDKTDLIS